jgi:altronate hydrolase
MLRKRSSMTRRDIEPAISRATFQGIVRDNGDVATRNHIGVFVVGNCGATAARKAADYFDEERLADYPNVDGVVPFVHEIGCGMEMTGEPMDLLRRTLSGYIRHPNTAAAVVIALGCERNNLKSFLEQEKLETGAKLRTVTIQDIGGIRKAVDEARRIVSDMLSEANAVKRTTVSAEHLKVGLQSGGADEFCGVSANPALGAAMDILVRNGGTAILSETPDLYGREQVLADRAVSPEVGAKLIDRMAWWLQYSKGRDTPLNGRSATLPGPSRDGISKAGGAALKAVYRYAERVTERGLVFMDTPSYDPVSVTGQIAGGANIIALTTGLGSSFGSLPAPTVKLSSNTPLYTRMAEDLDIDCGGIVDGKTTVEAMGRVIFERILRHASGEKTRSEIDGLGENEFVPWPIGVLA